MRKRLPAKQAAEVALRTAAVSFARDINEPPRDQHDREGMRRNQELLRAAQRYADTLFFGGAR